MYSKITNPITNTLIQGIESYDINKLDILKLI